MKLTVLTSPAGQQVQCFAAFCHLTTAAADDCMRSSSNVLPALELWYLFALPQSIFVACVVLAAAARSPVRSRIHCGLQNGSRWTGKRGAKQPECMYQVLLRKYYTRRTRRSNHKAATRHLSARAALLWPDLHVVEHDSELQHVCET